MITRAFELVKGDEFIRQNHLFYVYKTSDKLIHYKSFHGNTYSMGIKSKELVDITNYKRMRIFN